MQAANTVSFAFASNEMRQRPDTIRSWAAQNNNLFLKKLATEVIDVAGGK